MPSIHSFAAWLSPGRAFFGSVLLAASAVLVAAAGSQLVAASSPGATAQTGAEAGPAPHPLGRTVQVTLQIQPADLAGLGRQYAAVVDLRPDGEEPGQPSAQDMRLAATKAGLAFAYVPVPHGDISEASVAALQAFLASQSGPVLLYCRSGRRAARTWALVEAARPGGMPTDAIMAAVQGAGQNAEDLRGRIEAAVAARARVPS